MEDGFPVCNATALNPSTSRNPRADQSNIGINPSVRDHPNPVISPENAVNHFIQNMIDLSSLFISFKPLDSAQDTFAKRYDRFEAWYEAFYLAIVESNAPGLI